MELKRYRKVNRIKQFNFQINRVLTYGEEACDEELVIKYLSDVRTIEEWYEAWTKLSAIAIDNNKVMHNIAVDTILDWIERIS